MAISGSLFAVALVWWWAGRLDPRSASPDPASLRWGVLVLWLSCAASAVAALRSTYRALDGVARDELAFALDWLELSVVASYAPPLLALAWLGVCAFRDRRIPPAEGG